ncbi:MAG TPA: hypothetical protein VFS02_21340 [Telluria sp.]|nr:hypothetical protein [Telluria sp.]
MDMQHFQIIVNQMLAWSEEPKAPKKTVAARHPGIAAPRDAFDDEDEEELIDDDFEPDEELNIKAEAAESDEAEVSVVDPVD